MKTTATRERGFFVAPPFSLFLAFRAQPEELELVCDSAKPMATPDLLLQFVNQAFLKLHHPGAALANQVMVMAIVSFRQELKTSHAVAEFVTLNHAHALQEVQGTVNRGKITAIRQGRMDIPHGQRVILLAEQIQNGLARAGQLAGAASKPAGQFRERKGFAAPGRMPVGMGVGVLSHGQEVFPV